MEPLSPPNPRAMSLTCPKCGAGGVVDWCKLGHSLRCHRCENDFVVAKGGRVVSLSAEPQVSYVCPRCRRSGTIPGMLTGNGANCASCQLPLSLAPDGRLYGVERAEQLRREAAHQLKLERLRDERLAAQWREPVDPRKRARMIGAVLGSVCLLTLAIVFWDKYEHSPDVRAQRFTEACLSGDWNEAHAFLEDDAVQQVEFDRWRLRHFASIVEQHRPAGDSASVRVTLLPEAARPSGESKLSEANGELVFDVRMSSPFLGERSHRQTWHLRSGAWHFNALGTLTEEDRPTMARRTSPGKL